MARTGAEGRREAIMTPAQRTPRRQPHVWVVEMVDGKRWMPCSGASLFKDTGAIELSDWKRRNPNDSFRLVKYARELPPAARQRRGR